MSDKPALLILGDSHAIALRQGADMLGLAAEELQFSGAGWHDQRFALGENGLEVRGIPRAAGQLRALREKLGVADVFASGIPVLTTVGFHLGRLVPPFGWNGHQVQEEDAPGITEGLTASRAFTQDYVQHYRRRHFRLLRRLARLTPLIVVVPPRVHDRPNYDSFQRIITEDLRGLGLTVYDPADDLAGEDGFLPEDLMAEDGIHATAECGAMMIEAMRGRGLLPA